MKNKTINMKYNFFLLLILVLISGFYFLNPTRVLASICSDDASISANQYGYFPAVSYPNTQYDNYWRLNNTGSTWWSGSTNFELRQTGGSGLWLSAGAVGVASLDPGGSLDEHEYMTTGSELGIQSYTAMMYRVGGTPRTTDAGGNHVLCDLVQTMIYGGDLNWFGNQATLSTTVVPVPYTVTGIAGANGAISPASQEVNNGSTTTLTVTPNTGYTASASGCGGSLVGTTYTTGVISAPCTVTASFSINSYTVTFDGNTSTGGSTAAQSLVYNTPTALTSNGFTKTDYTFAGWATTAGGAVAYANGASYTIGAAGVTLYAKWTINPTNGGWTAWSAWGACSVSACGLTGTQTSTRTCTSPSPANGGLECLKTDNVTRALTETQTQSCSTAACGVMSGTLTSSASSCVILSGASTCSVNLTWTTTNPEATSAVTASGMSNVVGNSGGPTAFNVTYPSRIFYLYNNAKSLVPTSPGGAGVTVTSSCNTGTAWDGSVCSPLVMSGTLTSSASSCVILSGASTCSVNLTWTTTNPEATSAVTASGMTNVSGNSGGPTAFTVTHPSRIFYLYNNGKSIVPTSPSGAGVTVTTSCDTGTAWDGSACSSTSVGVVDCSEVKLTPGINLSTTSIYTGESARITWSWQGSGSCTGRNFSNSGGISGVTAVNTSGSVLVSPISTTTYTLDCNDSTASNAITITVKKRPAFKEN